MTGAAFPAGNKFLLRAALAYLVVPPIGPALLILDMMRGAPQAHPGIPFDWFGPLLLYTIFSQAAMILLGTPLLWLYWRYRWAGYASFIAGGFACAAATYLAVARDRAHWDQFVLFSLFGVVEGVCLRVVLFGFRAVVR